MRIVKKKHINSSHNNSSHSSNLSDNLSNNNNINSQQLSSQTPKLNEQNQNLNNLENERKIIEFVESKGFKIISMNGDGNCMFRAIAYQIYGDQEMHDQIRHLIMNYMDIERDHYSPYVSTDYNEYIQQKRQDKCYGNSLELLAASEMFNRPVEVYSNGEEPLKIFNSESSTEIPIRVSYHNQNHYNAVEDPNNPTFGVGLGLPNLSPGYADKQQVEEALHKSEQCMIDKIKETTELEQIENDLIKSISTESQDNIEESILEQSRKEYCQMILKNCTKNE